jgi:hypothetical protein
MPLTDTWLPVIGDDDQALDDQANTGIGLLYPGKDPEIGPSCYFFRKDTEAKRRLSPGIRHQHLRSPDQDPIVKDLSLTRKAHSRAGPGVMRSERFGGHFHLDYSLGDKTSLFPHHHSGRYLLSGDDPETEKVEGWDPLWSRWP